MQQFQGQLALLGIGNMAGAMLARWLNVGAVAPNQVRGVERLPERATELSQTLRITCGTDAVPAVVGAQVVLLACKPQQVAELLSALRPRLTPDQLAGQIWVSILAGVSLQQLQTLLPGPTWVRWMPNTPVRLGAGVVGEVADGADTAQLAPLRQALGLTVDLQERQMDGFTAVSGCGPAYVFALAESLATAALAQGFASDVAEALARQTVAGAAQLLASSALSAGQLRTEVTSKGGMTEAALEQLTRDGWPLAMTTAVQAAVDRASALRAGATA
jgi:pyrroline-5-carboxylate reductase